MTKYAKDWEKRVLDMIEAGDVTEEVLSEHLLKITWLQHERLIHLLVMCLTVLVLLVFFVLMLFSPGVWMGILFAVLFVLAGAYIQHYYYLENTVQRWYLLADTMKDNLEHDR